jgi:hypothetical protein
MFLHNHPEFADLIRIVADNESIDNPALIEKDYWIMHCLLSDPEIRKIYKQAYNETPRLYYREQPSFDEILSRISRWADRL